MNPIMINDYSALQVHHKRCSLQADFFNTLGLPEWLIHWVWPATNWQFYMTVTHHSAILAAVFANKPDICLWPTFHWKSTVVRTFHRHINHHSCPMVSHLKARQEESAHGPEHISSLIKTMVLTPTKEPKEAYLNLILTCACMLRGI
jgi:hypothetical protein